MLKSINAPRLISHPPVHLARVLTAVETRIYREQVLMELETGNGQLIAITSPYHGWVRQVWVRPDQEIMPRQALLLIDVVDVVDYHPDGQEVDASTELGEKGRRGLERELLRKRAQGYAAALFEAPEHGGMGARGVPVHPLMQQAKEGVPPKMRGQTSENSVAADRLVENANHDPQLRQQLSQQLSQSLHITSTPSTSPQLKA